MSDNLLSPDELFGLTGYRQKSKQAAWLKSEGFKFRLNAQLQPRVDRQHYLAKMGGASRHTEVSGPDWSAMGDNIVELPRRAA